MKNGQRNRGGQEKGRGGRISVEGEVRDRLRERRFERRGVLPTGPWRGCSRRGPRRGTSRGGRSWWLSFRERRPSLGGLPVTSVSLIWRTWRRPYGEPRSPKGLPVSGPGFVLKEEVGTVDLQEGQEDLVPSGSDTGEDCKTRLCQTFPTGPLRPSSTSKRRLSKEDLRLRGPARTPTCYEYNVSLLLHEPYIYVQKLRVNGPSYRNISFDWLSREGVFTM